MKFLKIFQSRKFSQYIGQKILFDISRCGPVVSLYRLQGRDSEFESPTGHIHKYNFKILKSVLKIGEKYV